jgi:hypothetical protein
MHLVYLVYLVLKLSPVPVPAQRSLYYDGYRVH